MGYMTDFSGALELPGLKESDFAKLDSILTNHRCGLSPDEIILEKTDIGYQIRICGVWKNYHEELENLVRAVVRRFPRAVSGRIEACGEDRSDNWALEASEGKVKLITYQLALASEVVIFDSKEGGRKN